MYQLKALPRNIKKYLLRMEVEEVEPLYQHEKLGAGERKGHFAPAAAV